MNIDSGSALIVIDQQKGIDYPQLGLRNNNDASSVILGLLGVWRKHNWPIFHVRHKSATKESVFWPYQEGFEFKPDFLPRENEAVIEKSTPCAFTKTNLQAILNGINITSIVVVGASTSNSVETTVRTGACLGFNVTAIEDACFTFAKPDYFGNARSANEVHAMSLANLKDEYAAIMHSSELEYAK